MRRSIRWRVAAVTVAFVLPSATLAQQPVNGGDGTLFFLTYAETIQVVDESTFEVTREIPLSIGLAISMSISQDRERLYVMNAGFEKIEVIEIASGRSVDQFTLSEDNKTVRMWGFDIEPRERFAILLVKTTTKEVDRYETTDATLLRYDLKTHEVTDTIPWPDGEERDFAGFMFSQDGELAYFFADEVIVLETKGFTEVDRWALEHELDDGMGRFNFGFPSSPYEEPGYYTGLFRVTDPVQNRRMMGVARVHLDEREVEFYMLGPSESVNFRLAPGRTKAYGLRQQVGNYEFWTFDLEGRRIEKKQSFAGRPRMGLIPSSNGKYLYIVTAGSTIDIYDAETYELVRTVTLDADMIDSFLLPGDGE